MHALCEGWLATEPPSRYVVRAERLLKPCQACGREAGGPDMQAVHVLPLPVAEPRARLQPGRARARPCLRGWRERRSRLANTWRPRRRWPLERGRRRRQDLSAWVRQVLLCTITAMQLCSGPIASSTALSWVIVALTIALVTACSQGCEETRGAARHMTRLFLWPHAPWHSENLPKVVPKFLTARLLAVVVLRLCAAVVRCQDVVVCER